ncbi:DUF6879 family protein [Nocardia sp. NPDC051756]|uniref:DUF6879 family protein n=1 Tax=Nocardia sp. NPDC051756 TaxID=3154751 RepID=UPI003424CFBF
MLDQAKSRAFHLETDDDYLAANETDSLTNFFADETADPGGDWFIPWGNQVGRMAARGVSVQRARVVSEPHTGYTRYLLALAPHNVDAGEDVRYLPRTNADPTDAASEDFWLLDDEAVAFSVFDERGFWSGGAVTTDTAIVRYAAEIRDRVWSAAIPFREYVTRQAL